MSEKRNGLIEEIERYSCSTKDFIKNWGMYSSKDVALLGVFHGLASYEVISSIQAIQAGATEEVIVYLGLTVLPIFVTIDLASRMRKRVINKSLKDLK